MYHILRYKNLSRSILKHIFDNLIYCDHKVFGIIEIIIKKYGCSDRTVKNMEIQSRIGEAQSTLNHLRSIGENRSIEAESKIINSLDEHIKLLKSSILEVDKTIKLYEDSYDISNDNVYVLSNLAWEQIIMYLQIDRGKDHFNSVVSLLCAIIEEVGDFFRNRIVQKKYIFTKIFQSDSIREPDCKEDDTCLEVPRNRNSSSKLAEAIIDNFKEIGPIRDELLQCIANCGDNDKAVVLKKKLHDKFET
jgi:hypothetical protein